MPKSMPINPSDVRKKGKLKLEPILLNVYDRKLKDEVAAYGADEVRAVYHDMVAIRMFETMLNDIKTKGKFEDIPYDHKGPAHLSIGQEASAVGQALNLGVDDHIFGSHRSHGEILAKGLSAIRKLDEPTLTTIMKSNLNGDTLRVVDDGSHTSARSLAIDFLLYGALAEIFGREPGFNRGMGGSMHAFFVPFGIYPNNAIVGGSADISVGAALYKKVNRKPGVVVCNIGDGSLGCGPVWEALCLANMDQFKTLWDQEHKGGLPFILNVVNNFYGMGGQPVGETMGFKVLARLGAGISPDQMHAERVDGYNPLALADAIKRKKELIAAGEGPILLDVLTYRYSGHSPSDASSYREKAEVEAWQQVDSIDAYAADLKASGVAADADMEAIRADLSARVLKAYKKAIDLEVSPRANLFAVGNLLERTMFSNQVVESMEPGRAPDVLMPMADNPRVKQLAQRSRSGYDENGALLSKARVVGIRDALFEAIIDRFYTDPTLVAYGEEVRDWGGAFAVYRGLTEALPYHRLFNSPISEAAIVGSACGYALEGGRALVELMYCDFLGRAGDEVFNQLAKWQSMSGGELKMPVVLRVSVGAKYGAQHSQDWSSICAHIPGLKVVFPATPYDAKGLMYSALLGTDPVIFCESQRLYDQAEIFHPGGVPAGAYTIPIGEPDIKRAGTDLTILTIGATLYRAIDAAKVLEKEHGISCEIIDARSIVPFDYSLVLESVKKTGSILLVSDACERGSALQTIAAKVAMAAFDDLDAPPVVLGARNWITPPDEIETSFFPYVADILDAVHTHIRPLKGYTATRDCSTEDMLNRSTAGL